MLVLYAVAGLNQYCTLLLQLLLQIIRCVLMLLLLLLFLVPLHAAISDNVHAAVGMYQDARRPGRAGLLKVIPCSIDKSSHKRVDA